MQEWNTLNIVRTTFTRPFYSVGTVTINASGVVTPHISTVTPVFDSTFVGRHMRVYYSDSFFEIASYSAPNITLKDWPGNIVSTPLAYSIFQFIYTLSNDIKVLHELAYNVTLTKKSQWYFNRLDPARTGSGEPSWWAFAGYDASQNIQVEIYPVPSGTYPLRAYGKRRIVPIPENGMPYLQEDLIENAALLQCYRLKMQSEPQGGWDARIQEQSEIFQIMLAQARDEDYQMGAHAGRVKDTMEEATMPVDNSFWAAHDDIND
jgi:hypothetical protein